MGDYVVTGAASGIGAAVAARLREAGYHVLGVDRAGADVQADLGTREGREQAIEQIEAAVESLDGYLAFAGIGPGTGRTGSDVVAINYFGAIGVLEGVRHLLVDGSAIVLTSSNSTTTQPGWPVELAKLCLDGDEAAACASADSYGDYASIFAYPATKAALAYYVRSRCADYIASGIRINAIAPGFIDTPMTRASREDPQVASSLDAYVELIPAGRAGRPEEIAGLVQFLVGPDAGYLVGSVIFVDGGLDAQLRTMDWPKPVRAQ